ncbi:hypothetical protein M514_27799, partial [Trichuris suis]
CGEVIFSLVLLMCQLDVFMVIICGPVTSRPFLTIGVLSLNYKEPSHIRMPLLA